MASSLNWYESNTTTKPTEAEMILLGIQSIRKTYKFIRNQRNILLDNLINMVNMIFIMGMSILNDKNGLHTDKH